MKNKTFILVTAWIFLWSLITFFYFSIIEYGFLILILSYELTGIGFIIFIIKEEFFKRFKTKEEIV